MANPRIDDHPIASGRTADIYAWGDGTVVKLFHDRVSLSDIEAERRKTLAVRRAGVAAPYVGEVVRHAGSTGLVFERLDGPTMLAKAQSNPDVMDSFARALAELHLGLHRVRSVAGLPAQRRRLMDRVSRCEALSPGERDALLEACTRLPDGDALCHGDFHPDNVIVTARGPVVIDWVDASIGNPVADVARTSLLLLGHIEAELEDDAQKAAVRRFHEIYLQHYMTESQRHRTGDLSELRTEHAQWLPVMAAARLSEGIAHQEDWLLAMVRSVI